MVDYNVRFPIENFTILLLTDFSLAIPIIVKADPAKLS